MRIEEVTGSAPQSSGAEQRFRVFFKQLREIKRLVPQEPNRLQQQLVAIAIG